MIILFVPYRDNPADNIFSAPAFFILMWLTGFAVLTILGYAAFKRFGDLTGRLMTVGVLIYLSYEIYILPNTVKLITAAFCTAAFAAFSLKDRKKAGLICAGVPALIALCFIIYLTVNVENGIYSIADTMPVVDPFIYGKLRYHSLLSALKDYLKYEPRTVLRVPMLYLWLFMACFTAFFAGAKEKAAAVLSFAVWFIITFLGREYSFIGYYWVYTVSFIPAIFILLYFFKDVRLPDEKRMYVHTALSVILPVVILNSQYIGSFRFAGKLNSGLYSNETSVYLYEVNPYELTGK